MDNYSFDPADTYLLDCYTFGKIKVDAIAVHAIMHYKKQEQAMSYTFDTDVVSDLHKDARGFRPREGFWSYWNLSTNDEKQAIWDGLLRELDIAFEEDKRREREAVSRMEAGLELIEQTFGCDRETAIVHFVESLKLDKYDLMYGGSYICFELGLPYEMQALFEPAVTKLLAKMEVEEVVDTI